MLVAFLRLSVLTSTVGTVAVTPGRPGEEDYGPCREEVQLYLPLVVMVGGCFPDSPRARKASFSNDVLGES